ncbi:uncharacterized protein LOC115921493 [Strongylocentrotus purpuratus]|uniref:Uncharacterized protein n=1 Tax=Strongylocentrotus purpuratus TaxID=7668 RepID=A0A7M7SVP2_STRPU|nr:uncharacterized protein LOC115921493 [Strongylocentrotus purpuratus]
MLKRWKSFYRKKETCHSELRKSLETLGLKECIVNVAPAKYLYKVELLRIAFNLLMRDVLPFIDALGMNPKQITKYKASSPELERGSFGLLQQLWKRTPKSDTHRRRDFCLALRNIGYEGLARSVYLDYEPSQSELNSTVSVLWNAERLQICTRLELGEDDQAACLGTEGQVNLVEVVRRWTHQIRPVPYHYRREIGTCLRAAGRQDVADQILAGRKGKMQADENVLRNICRRLEADKINNLCKLLDLKRGKSLEENIISVIKGINKWINDFDPSSWKSKLAVTQLKLKHRKKINNNMFYLGCHELAEEIMHLENGILSE